MPRTLSFLLLLALSFACGLAHAAQTLLVLSEGAPAYEMTARRIGELLGRQQPPQTVEAVPVAQVTASQLSEAKLVITIGTQAAESVVNSFQPDRLICALLTHQTFARLPPVRAGAQRSAVFIDQPAYRQLALVRAALPGVRRLAVVYSDASLPLVDALKAAAQPGMPVDSAAVSDDQPLYNALRDVLTDDSVLITVPDTTVYNNFTIQNVLLTAYRQHTPVIGFSPAYVRAGAVAAVYSTPEQVGDQVAAAALQVLRGGALPPPAFPLQFSVSTNPHVARSLSLDMPKPEQLEAQIRRTERPR